MYSVRQGESLFPFLFAIYLNNLEDFLDSNNVKGLSLISTKFESELNGYLFYYLLTTSFPGRDKPK